jgi:hypothetical protein
MMDAAVEFSRGDVGKSDGRAAKPELLSSARIMAQRRRSFIVVGWRASIVRQSQRDKVKMMTSECYVE